MTDVLVALVWAGALLLVVRWLLPLADRLVFVAELRAAPAPTPPPARESPTIPDDVVAMIQSESEQFARDQGLTRVLELYADVRPAAPTDHEAWALVRQQFLAERETTTL